MGLSKAFGFRVYELWGFGVGFVQDIGRARVPCRGPCSRKLRTLKKKALSASACGMKAGMPEPEELNL